MIVFESSGRLPGLMRGPVAAMFGLLILAASCIAPPAWAQTTPAQQPLVNRGASVKPNIVFIFDDSGSMNFPCIYQPNVNQSLATESAAGKLPGQDITCLSSGMRQNSPANNTLMYDPKKLYLPRIDDAGATQAANSTASTTVTVYLPKSGVDVTQYTTGADLELASRYDKLEIKTATFALNGAADTSLNPLLKSAARTDCAAADRCTIAEEGRNVANWRSYHSSRLLSAQSGVGRAFYTQPDTFRLGWSRLVRDAGQSNTDGITGVQDFGASRAGFFKWLNAIIGDNPIGTSLKFTLDKAGRYYERTDNAGPWAHTPWAPGTEVASAHLSCRRSYAILMTDGFWNDKTMPDTVSGRDTDGLDGARIDHASNGTSYQYKPHDLADVRNAGKADATSGAGNAGTLADVALHYWARDLRILPNNASPGAPGDPPFWQNMTTYAISFGADGKMTTADIANARAGRQNWSVPVSQTATALDDLIHAAHNGGGEYLSVRDADAFTDKLGRILSSIGGQQTSEAGIAASATALVSGTRKFVPYYTPNLWWGNLKMVALDANGKEAALQWQVVATDANRKPTGVSTIPAFADRKVWVWVDAARHAVAFDWPAVSTYGLMAATATANTGTLLVNTAKQPLVDYLRGDRANEGGARAFRQREALLGDIVNSTPVFIKNISSFGYEKLPSTVPGVAQYGDYMKAKALRSEGVVFVGANDGMVHGFREGGLDKSGGAEVFAWIPRAVLGSLHKLADKAYQHQYFVDGPLSEADAYIQTPDATGSNSPTGWRNLVLGTTGAGAKAVFALNVTNPLAMTGNSVLWEANNSMPGFEELGHVLTPVQTGLMQDGTWVAIFGNGYYSKSGKVSLFIVNLATGALIKRLEPAIGAEAGANGLGGVRLVLNASRQIMGAYAGDLKGRVWKFDLNSSTQSKWVIGLDGKALFTALDSRGVAQSITAMPAVVERNDIAAYKPSYMVVAATGKLFDTTDPANTAMQAAYGLWDQNKFGEAGGTAISAAKLVPLTVAAPATGYYQVSSARPVDWSSDRGWMLRYNLAAGQRTIYPVEMLGPLVRIDTIVPPASTAPVCTSQFGLGYNFLISPLDGSCKASSTLDVTGDGKINAEDGNACGYATIADGADTVLSTTGLNDGAGRVVSIQSSGGDRLVRLDNGEPPPKTSNTSSRSWRQIFMRAQ